MAGQMFIVTKDKNGLGLSDKEGEKPWVYKVTRGEIVVQLLATEKREIEKGKPPATHRLYCSHDYIILSAEATDVIPLEEVEAQYLLAVETGSKRWREYRNEDKKVKMNLAVDDMVTFTMKIEPGAEAASYVDGKIRYIGHLSEKDGIHFGIEIQEEKYHGKGTSNGRPHFNCGPNNAVYVSMDKIERKIQNRSRIAKKPFHQHTGVENKEDVIKEQPRPEPKVNTRGQAKGGFVSNIKQKFGGSSYSTDTNVDSKFKADDRVVLHSVKGEVITGTVKYVGSIRLSKEVADAPISVVGVETDKSVEPAEDFPDLDLTASFSGKHFKILPGHSRVFLPEQLVITVAEHSKQQQMDGASHSKKAVTERGDVAQSEKELAAEFGMSISEYRQQQKDYVSTTAQGKESRKKPLDSKIEVGEEVLTTGGRGIGRGEITGNIALTETLYNLNSGKPVGEERVEKERIALEEMKSQHAQQHQHGQYHTNDYQVIDGGSESIVEDGYVQIAPYTSSSEQDDERRGQSHDYHNLPPEQPPHYNHSHHPPPPADPHLTIGSMVYIHMQRGEPLYGVIKWIGTLPEFPGVIAGVEMERPLRDGTDGTWSGTRFFTCPPGRAYFCPLKTLKQDNTYVEKRQENGNPLEKKAPTNEDYDTIVTPNLFNKYIGDEHGIQGHHNSCYLDSTVFGLFALSKSFDDLLLEEPTEEVGRKVKYFLWKGIVNPLRKYGLARYESVMDLRDSLEEFGRMKGANKDEKDPEEFLNLLFKEVLHITPFLSIKRPFGVEQEFFIQLFFEIDPNNTEVPKTDKLLTQMFHEQLISFTRAPSKLLLQMPRFGKDFKMYNRIIPSLTLDVKPLLDPSARGEQKCFFCLENLASHACYTCPNEVFHNAQSYTYYCSGCHESAHRAPSRKGHSVVDVNAEPGTSDVDQFSKMELLSVICIETSHYVCYTRSGDKWLFHDSMANRLYDMYNIPRVVDVTVELQEWIYSCDNLDRLMNTPAKNIPEYVRRFTQDIYMCVYVNTDLDMYQ